MQVAGRRAGVRPHMGGWAGALSMLDDAWSGGCAGSRADGGWPGADERVRMAGWARGRAWEAGQVFGRSGTRADGMRSGGRSGSRADDGWPVAGEAQMVEHHGAQMLIMMTLDIGRCLLYTIVARNISKVSTNII